MEKVKLLSPFFDCQGFIYLGALFELLVLVIALVVGAGFFAVLTELLLVDCPLLAFGLACVVVGLAGLVF